ncbi:MAG: undecaprenyl/decaprenyl-phosphate alpha-N-acetylglucosaminyl 1-phosphate transferase [Candidatus Eremiobacteraeota bacterium]|nr:undecaprenyl/decaprenyl-phosphate alpha-N-acetylglucosaminyl 1-phosphate transferase [Candidatus Eremiobacteraeota bacterium]
MIMAITFFLAFATAIVTAGFVTPLIRKLATKAQFVDVVDDRRMHAEPKPRLGGLAIYLGFAFALFVSIGVALKTSPTLFHRADDIHDALGLLFGGTMIVIVGVWDDVMGMRARTKFISQLVVAVVSMSYGFIISGFDVPFVHQYVNVPIWIGIPLTALWYIGMMNAINFLDGLDGLLAGVTAISGLFLFAIAIGHGHLVPALILCALVGAATGFLPYNFNPAKIILGDTGSLFIGYVFATVSIIVTAKVAITVSLLVPLVALALPVVDTAVAIGRRLRAGRSIASPDRGHLHHLLIFKFGLNVRQAVLLIYAVSFVLGAAAYALSGGLPHARAHGIL